MEVNFLHCWSICHYCGFLWFSDDVHSDCCKVLKVATWLAYISNTSQLPSFNHMHANKDLLIVLSHVTCYGEKSSYVKLINFAFCPHSQSTHYL